MSSTFDPKHFAVTGATVPDPDADWMRVAENISATATRPSETRAHYLPAIPLSFLRAAAIAGDALELLLIALAEMRMRANTEIAIGPAVWRRVGNPSKHVRARLLRQIGTLPASLCTLTARKGRPHLLVTGPAWPRAAQTLRSNLGC